MDFGELLQLFFFMGDWYVDVEFIFVQLDNKVLEDDEWDVLGIDVVQDWCEFQKEYGEQLELYFKDLFFWERSIV